VREDSFGFVADKRGDIKIFRLSASLGESVFISWVSGGVNLWQGWCLRLRTVDSVDKDSEESA